MTHPRFRPLSTALVAACLLALAQPAALHAERADRLKPLLIEGTVQHLDLQHQSTVWTGDVVLSKGTMVIRAERVEARELPGGYYSATAFGTPGKPVTFKQKRDGVDETMEGEADRLEYDGKADTVRFVKNATLRRLRGAVRSDEITGNLITYDAANDTLNASGGATPSANNPGGRVRAVFTPQVTGAGAEAAPRTDAPPLKLSPTLSGIPDSSSPSGAKP